jgi:hypothetical protein
MKNITNKTEDARLKNLFRNIKTEQPAKDFTAKVMQQITTEKIAIVQQQDRMLWKWMMYSLIFISIFAVTVKFMPEIMRWAQSISIHIPQNYIAYLKNWGETMLSSIQYIYLSPALLAIFSSISLLISIVGLSNVGNKMERKEI